MHPTNRKFLELHRKFCLGGMSRRCELGTLQVVERERQLGNSFGEDCCSRSLTDLLTCYVEDRGRGERHGKEL